MKLCSVNGRSVWMATSNEIAKEVGLKARTIREWEKKGVLPRATVTEPMSSPAVGDCDRRLYSIGQVTVLKWWMGRVHPRKGRKLRDSEITLLHEKWDAETEKFLKSVGLQEE